MSANSNTQEAVNTTSSNVADDALSSETEQVAPATTTDVEDAEKEIDEAINSLDDAVDFAETDLSDTTLGL